MLNPSDSHRFRKTVAGLCMIGAPALFLASSIITPGIAELESEQLALIAGDRDAAVLSSLVGLGGWALFLIATLGVMHMLRERSAAAGHIGGGLAIIGTLAAVGGTAITLVMWQMASFSDTGAMVSLLTVMNDSSAIMIPFGILAFGVTIGYVVLAWALYRTHIAPAFIAAPLGAAAIVYMIGALTFSQGLYIVASALMLAGFAMLARLVLTETVEEWEHQPEFRGSFRSALGIR